MTCHFCHKPLLNPGLGIGHPECELRAAADARQEYLEYIATRKDHTGVEAQPPTVFLASISVLPYADISAGGSKDTRAGGPEKT